MLARVIPRTSTCVLPRLFSSSSLSLSLRTYSTASPSTPSASPSTPSDSSSVPYVTSPHPSNPYVRILESGLWVIDHTPFTRDHDAFTRTHGSRDSNAANFRSVFRDEDGSTPDPKGKALVAKAVAEACIEIGCFYIAGKGVVDTQSMINAREEARKFFSLSEHEKWTTSLKGFQRGYASFQEPQRSIAPNDPLQSFVMGPPQTDKPYYKTPEASQHIKPNVWPKYPPGFKDAWAHYWGATTRVADILLRSFSMSLDLPEEFLYKLCDKGAHLSKANYYSVIRKPLDDEPRVLQHTDATIFTILTHMDQIPKSLQARKRKTVEWVYADPIHDGTFINVGDFLERYTNKKFVSTVHRVDWPREGEGLFTERISNAFFALPNYDVKFGIAPTCVDPSQKGKPEEVTYAEFLANHRQRIKHKGY